jgi:GLPGLI family protein
MKNLLLALALLASSFTYAQNSEGTIRYLVTHNWTKKMAALDYITPQRKQKLDYMYGKNSEWKVYTVLHFNATESKYEDSEEKVPGDDDFFYAGKKETFFIKRDFANNKLHDVVSFSGKKYIVEDSIPKIEWKIMNEMKEVAGHVCMNATFRDSLRMHDITAWFALDIPLSSGPEHFGGLPGMILELDVANGAAVFTADKIDVKKLDQELALPKKKIKGEKVNAVGFNKIVADHYAEKRKNEEPAFWGMRY